MQRRREKRTAFKSLEPFLHLLELHLLANLLAFALAPPRLALRDARALIEQTLADTLHMRVRLDHFCKEVIRSREREAMIGSEGTRSLCTMQGSFVATLKK